MPDELRERETNVLSEASLIVPDFKYFELGSSCTSRFFGRFPSAFLFDFHAAFVMPLNRKRIPVPVQSKTHESDKDLPVLP